MTVKRQEPPLYVGNQIQRNPEWTKWFMETHDVCEEDADLAGMRKSLSIFDGDMSDNEMRARLNAAFQDAAVKYPNTFGQIPTLKLGSISLGQNFQTVGKLKGYTS